MKNSRFDLIPLKYWFNLHQKSQSVSSGSFKSIEYGTKVLVPLVSSVKSNGKIESYKNNKIYFYSLELRHTHTYTARSRTSGHS